VYGYKNISNINVQKFFYRFRFHAAWIHIEQTTSLSLELFVRHKSESEKSDPAGKEEVVREVGLN
jgi:hypothetical protein